MSHEQMSVFYEMVKTGGEYVNQIISVEGELANYVSNLSSIMEANLAKYEHIISHDNSEAMSYAFSHSNSQSAKRVQVWTSKMSSDTNMADNMKTLFNSNQQATTQILSKFGSDQSNFVQEMEGGILPMQQAASLLGSPYSE